MPDHAGRLGRAYAGLAQGLRIFVQLLCSRDVLRLYILSPFDPLIIQRKRTELFVGSIASKPMQPGGEFFTNS